MAARIGSRPGSLPSQIRVQQAVPSHTRGHRACPQHRPVSSHVSTELLCRSCNFTNQPRVSSHRFSRVDQLLLATKRGSISQSPAAGAECGAGGLVVPGGGIQGGKPHLPPGRSRETRQGEGLLRGGTRTHRFAWVPAALGRPTPPRLSESCCRVRGGERCPLHGRRHRCPLTPAMPLLALRRGPGAAERGDGETAAAGTALAPASGASPTPGASPGHREHSQSPAHREHPRHCKNRPGTGSFPDS